MEGIDSERTQRNIQQNNGIARIVCIVASVLHSLKPTLECWKKIQIWKRLIRKATRFLQLSSCACAGGSCGNQYIRETAVDGRNWLLEVVDALRSYICLVLPKFRPLWLAPLLDPYWSEMTVSPARSCSSVNWRSFFSASLGPIEAFPYLEA